MDIQMVGSKYGAAMYVCMYVSKAEPERLKYALHETLQQIPQGASQRKRLSLIGATVLTQTDWYPRSSIPSWWIQTCKINQKHSFNKLSNPTEQNSHSQTTSSTIPSTWHFH